MRISYRQGLVSYPTGSFQLNSSNGVDLVISPNPVLATIASGELNYLIGEYNNVTSAWGPFSGSTTQYLYWQINQVTGALERSSTTLPYILSASAPSSPAQGQLWWDTVNLITKEWTGVFWNPVLIVFAATLLNGATLQVQPLASQVGISGITAYAGFVLTDGYGGVFTDNDGNLLTTETPVISPDTGSEVKLDNSLIVLQASENISAFTCVYINAGTLAIASSAAGVNLSQAPIGMVTVPVYQNNAVTLATAGQMVVNQQWSYANNLIGSTVYCDANGQVTLTQPGTSSYVRVGIITGTQNILLTFDWMANVPAQGGGGSSSGVSEVLGTAPITIGGSGSYPVVAMPQVTTLQDGYLNSNDYSTFIGYASTIASKASLSTLWPISSIINLSTTLATFATTSTTWPQSSIQGLASTLSGYAPLSATWAISSVTGLQAQLNTINTSLSSKLSAVSGGVTGNFTTLNSSGGILDSGYSPSSFALTSATWPQSSIQGLATTLSALAPLTTVWPISSIVNLQSTLNTIATKADLVSSAVAGDFASLTSTGDLADSGYNHSSFALANATWPISSITGLQTALNSTLTTSSSIAISQITNLQSTLNTLMVSGTAIPISQVTGLQTSLNSFLPKAGGTMTGLLTVPTISIGTALAVGSSGALTVNGSVGTAGQVLTSAGAGVPPIWSTVTSSGGGDTSTTVNISTAPSNSTSYFLTLVTADAGSQQLYASANTSTFYYTPSSNTLTVGTVVGNLTGVASSATAAITASNIAGGTAGALAYQSGPGATSLLTPGIAGQFLTSTGPGSAPAWTTVSSSAQASAPAGQIIFGDSTGTTIASSAGLKFNSTTQVLNVSTIASSSPFTINGTTFTVQTSNVSQLGIDSTGAWYVNSIVGTAGQILTSSGPGVPPTWTTFTVPGASAPSGQLLYGDPTGTTTAYSSGLIFNPSSSTLTVEYINGQATSAINASNLLGGANGSIPYQSVTGDYLWANVSLLLNGAGIDGSTNFVDSSNYANTVNFTNATISANQALYGTTSISFPGVNSELAVPVTRGGQLDFVDGSFTVELAVFNSLSSYSSPVGLLGIGFPSSGSYGLDIFINSTTGYLTAIIGLSTGSPATAVGPAVPLQAWSQVAVCFNISTLAFTCFVNGVAGTTVTLPVTPATYSSTFGSSATSLFLGADGTHSALFGYMQEVRVTQGIARYSATYTPPSAAFSVGGGSSTQFVPAGTSGQVLTISSGVPTWAAVSGSGVSNANQLQGTTLASNVVNSSLTSVGTLTSLTVAGTIAGTFSGAGTGLTGTASSLSIGGTAALATSLAGGAAGSISYQTGANASAMLPIGTSGQTLQVVSGIPAWVTPSSISANSLTGTILASNVIASSLTSVGTLTSLTVAGTVNGTSFSGAGTGLTGTASSLSIGGTAAGNLLLSGGTLTGSLYLASDPTSSTQAATKNYVDNSISGLSYHPAAAVATTANITLSGEQTIDGVTTSSSRVLVKNQSTATTNGIYVSGTGAWTRASDANTGSELQNAAIFVGGGTTQAATAWVFTTGSTSVTIGTTPINFYQIGAASLYSAGTGISLTGSVFSNTGVLSITAGSGVTVTVTGTGNLTISATGTISSITGTANQIIATNTSGAVVLSLPATINVGITGNAATATSASSATVAANLSGGAAGSLPYQSANGVTSLLPAGTAGQVLTSGGTSHPVWVTSTTATPVIATSAMTAVAYNMIVADTSAGSFTITLPASPVFGQRVYFIDGAGTWGTSPLTISGNGININGSSLNLQVASSYDNFSLFYYNPAQGWIIGVS